MITKPTIVGGKNKDPNEVHMNLAKDNLKSVANWLNSKEEIKVPTDTPAERSTKFGGTAIRSGARIAGAGIGATTTTAGYVTDAGSATIKYATSHGGLTIFLILAIFFHMLDLFTRMNGAGIALFDPKFMLVHLAILPLAGYALIPTMKNKRGLETLMGFGITAYLLPIGLNIPFIINIVQNTLGIFVYTMLLAFLPVWGIFVMTRGDNEKSKWLSRLSTIYIVGWLFLVIIVFSGPAIANGNYGPLLSTQNLGGLFSVAIDEGYTAIRDMTIFAGKQVDVVKQGISGNYTQQNVARQVTPSDFKAVVLWDTIFVLGSPPYTRDIPLELEAKIKTKMLDDEHPIPISIQCETSGATPDQITITPQSPYIAQGTTEQSEIIQCAIDENVLNAGTHKITFIANYSMEAFTKLDFTIGKEEQFIKDNIGEYKPKTTELAKAIPAATYSSSKTPLRIDLGTPEKYFVLRANKETEKYNPSITLTRTEFNGKAIVHSIAIITPKNIGITISPKRYSIENGKKNCDYLKKQYNLSNIPCTDATRDVYEVNTQEMLVENEARLSVALEVSKNDWEKVLGGGAFAQKTIYAIASYTYTTKKEKSVQVSLSAQEQETKANAANPQITKEPIITTTSHNAKINITIDRTTYTIQTKYGIKDQDQKETITTSCTTKTCYIGIGDNNRKPALQPGTTYKAELTITDTMNRKTIKEVEFTTTNNPGATS